MQKLESIRKDYGLQSLDESDLPVHPISLLQSWLQHAVEKQISDPNAMTLSTIDSEGFPSSRVVLAKQVTDRGLSFFTSYRSSKAKQIEHCSKASTNFFWSALERQVRVLGQIKKLSDEESDRYFATRPRDSQIGAWASPQSDVIADRQVLEELVRQKTKEFENLTSIPRPPFWGGYILEPAAVEFWQGRPSRLHDRFLATYKEGTWFWQRLAP